MGSRCYGWKPRCRLAVGGARLRKIWMRAGAADRQSRGQYSRWIMNLSLASHFGRAAESSGDYLERARKKGPRGASALRSLLLSSPGAHPVDFIHQHTADLLDLPRPGLCSQRDNLVVRQSEGAEASIVGFRSQGLDRLFRGQASAPRVRRRRAGLDAQAFGSLVE